ncbi:MAG TPA: hypothetical protein VFA11_03345 [Acidimicrobiales bacterium]|nr:hypothetical protein [Acidimicrobiales bacterium]
MSSQPLDFECPRCARPASQATYGPCADCRHQLRARFEGDGRQVEVARYEPKMNVVPNQVATKD